MLGSLDLQQHELQQALQHLGLVQLQGQPLAQLLVLACRHQRPW